MNPNQEPPRPDKRKASWINDYNPPLYNLAPPLHPSLQIGPRQPLYQESPSSSSLHQSTSQPYAKGSVLEQLVHAQQQQYQQLQQAGGSVFQSGVQQQPPIDRLANLYDLAARAALGPSQPEYIFPPVQQSQTYGNNSSSTGPANMSQGHQNQSGSQHEQQLYDFNSVNPLYPPLESPQSYGHGAPPVSNPQGSSYGGTQEYGYGQPSSSSSQYHSHNLIPGYGYGAPPAASFGQSFGVIQQEPTIKHHPDDDENSYGPHSYGQSYGSSSANPYLGEHLPSQGQSIFSMQPSAFGPAADSPNQQDLGNHYGRSSNESEFQRRLEQVRAVLEANQSDPRYALPGSISQGFGSATAARNTRQPVAQDSFGINSSQSALPNQQMFSTFVEREESVGTQQTSFDNANVSDAHISDTSSMDAVANVVSPKLNPDVPMPDEFYPAPPTLSVFQRFLNNEDIMFKVCRLLPAKDMINFYSISKKFHRAINEQITSVIVGNAETRMPESADIFRFKVSKHLCNLDPNRNPSADKRKEVRDAPTLRWLSFLEFREATVESILQQLALKGLRLPRTASRVIKKVWFLMDIPDTKRRIGVIHNPRLWSDSELYVANMFFMKLDMACTDPINGRAERRIRKMLLAQRTLSVTDRVLKREEMQNQSQMLRMFVEWNLNTEQAFADPDVEISQTIFGVPLSRLASLQCENWTPGGDYLMRPDELVTKEAIRRELRFQDKLIDMMIYGNVHPITGQDVFPRSWDGEVQVRFEDEVEDQVERDIAIHASKEGTQFDWDHGAIDAMTIIN